MGGWEEEPPAPDDSRLGAENLTKDFVPAQKPFEVVIAIHPSINSIGSRAEAWLDDKKPVLSTLSPEAFSSHSLGVLSDSSNRGPTRQHFEHHLEYSDDAFVFDQEHTGLLANFLVLAIASCQGDRTARSRLSESSGRISSSARLAKL